MNIAIIGVYETPQARSHPDRSPMSLIVEAAQGAIADAGLAAADIDGVSAEWPGPGGSGVKPGSQDWARLLGGNLTWIGDTVVGGPMALMQAYAAINAGLCSTVLIAGGQSGVVQPRGSAVLAYTRAQNEFVETWGTTTPVQFALLAQRHMSLYGTTRRQMARVASTIRNNGAINSKAVMYGRGPYSIDDILEAPPIASPFTILDLSLVSEGAAAIVVTNKFLDGPRKPVRVASVGAVIHDNAYVNPAIWEVDGRKGAALVDLFGKAGACPDDVDTFQFYDPTSFEVIRQFEIFGYCKPGEGGDFVDHERIEIHGSHPICTDGGLLSHAHLYQAQMTQKLIESVEQLRGDSGPRQVPGASVALATGGGPPTGFYAAALLTTEEE